MMNLSKLSAPFDTSLISWRVGATTADKSKGIALAFVDARDVMQRLDEVCGVENWQCRYTHAEIKTICEIGIRINNEWVWKANGAGDTQVEAEKGAISDAFKRAAVLWGVGRYLYDVHNVWVELKQQGRSYVIADQKDARLIGALEKAAAGIRVVGDAPNEKTPQERAEEFCTKAIYEIEKIDTIAELNKWSDLNTRKVNALIKYKDINDRFNNAYEASFDRISIGQ